MTLAEIYDAIMSVDAAVKRIEGNQKDESERIKGRLRELEDRVTAIERATSIPPPPNGGHLDG